MEKDFMSKEEVADMIMVSPRTIDNWITSREFPFIKITEKKRIFKREDVLSWLKDKEENKICQDGSNTTENL